MFHFLVSFWIGIFGLSRGALNQLQCNGIETRKYNMTTAIPAGVCSAGYTSSFILKCDHNNTMYYRSYDSSTDCTGPYTTTLASNIYSLSTYEDINIVCNMSSCTYLTVTTYNNLSFSNANHTKCDKYLNDKNHFKPKTHTISMYVDNYCNEMPNKNAYKWHCEDVFPWKAGRHIYQYNGLLDCEGRNTDGSSGSLSDYWYQNIEQCDDINNLIFERESDANPRLIVNFTCDIANSYMNTPSPIPIEINDLQCNGIETIKDDHDIKSAIPAGVCYKNFTSSYILKCHNNNTMYYHKYDLSNNCTGSFTKIPITNIYKLSEYDGLNIVCNMDNCPYIIFNQYNSFKSFETYSQCDQYLINSTYMQSVQSNTHTLSMNVQNYSYSSTGMNIQWYCDASHINHITITGPHSGVHYSIPFGNSCGKEDLFKDYVFPGGYRYYDILMVNGVCDIANSYYMPIITTLPSISHSILPSISPSISSTLSPSISMISSTKLLNSTSAPSENLSTSKKLSTFIAAIIIISCILLLIVTVLMINFIIKRKKMKEIETFQIMDDTVEYS